MTEKTYIYGAGGHAMVVIDAWRRTGADWDGCLDDNPAKIGRLIMGIKIQSLGSADLAGVAVHVAIGSNQRRCEIACRLFESGVTLLTVIHPEATIAEGANIGAGCLVAARAVVGPGANLGLGSIINHGAIVDHECMVSDWAHVAPGAILGGGSMIGARALVGAGAVVLPGCTVGNNAVVGAGAIVTKDVAAGSTVLGIPARVVRN